MTTTSTATMLFADLVSSTERQSRMGDDASDEFRRRLFGALRHAAEQSRGDVIKYLGDGLMVVFRASTLDALTCALVMHENAASIDPFDPPLLRIGISAGEVSEDDGDVFGMPVIEAARLCAAAQPSQTLATDVVRALVGNRGRFELASVGDLELKGIPEPVATVQLRRLAADAPDSRFAMIYPLADTTLPSVPGAAAFPALPSTPPSAPPSLRAAMPLTPSVSATATESQTPSSGSRTRLTALVVGGVAVIAVALLAVKALGGGDESPAGAGSVDSVQTVSTDAAASVDTVAVNVSDSSEPNVAQPEAPTQVSGPAASSEPVPFVLEDQRATVAFYPGVTQRVFTFEVPPGTQIIVYWTSNTELEEVPVDVGIDRPVGEDIKLNVIGFDGTDFFTGTEGLHTVTVEVPEGTVGSGDLQISTTEP
jgi:class 3 adenylate cyclase